MRGEMRGGQEMRGEMKGEKRRGKEERKGGDKRRRDHTKNLILNGLRFAFLHQRTWKQ